jgi:hypothetical protein
MNKQRQLEIRAFFAFVLCAALWTTSASAQNYYDGQYHYRPKTEIDALSKVCGDLWTMHDIGVGLRIKSESISDDEGVDNARKIVDSANLEAMSYGCPRRSKALTEKAAKATIKNVETTDSSIVAGGLEDLYKQLKRHEQDYREALSNE